MSALREEYETTGFVFRPGLLSPAEARVLNAEFERLAAMPLAEQQAIREKDGVTLRTVVNPHAWNDLYARLTRHPALLGTVTALLGESVYAWQMGINCKAAFAGDVWFWHQDYPAYRADDHIPEPRMVNALVFLDEVTELNGPLMLVPGSHRRVESLPENASEGTSYTFRYAPREMVATEAARAGVEVPKGPTGSVIFMHVNTLHGSGCNLSPWSRHMITLTYNAMSNKATSPSIRPRHIVPDDRDAPALEPLGEGCLIDD